MFRKAKTVEKAHEDAIWTVCWSPNTNFIATGSVDETCKCWKADQLEEKESHSFSSYDLGVVSVCCNSKGTTLVSSSMDGYIRTHSLTDMKFVSAIKAGPVETWTIDHHPRFDLVASGTHTGKINLWDLVKGTKKATLSVSANVVKFAMSVAFSPNGAAVASGHDNGNITVFDLETEKPVHQIPGHKKCVRSVAFTRDSSVLLSASADNMVNMYDMKSGEQIASLQGHSSWVLDVSANPVRDEFVTSSSDKKVKVWDLKERECVHTFDEHQDQVWGVAYSPDGNQIASVSDDKSLILFDAKTG